MEQTTSCTRCGTKFAASRERCPKCRTMVPRVDPAAEAAQSRRLAQISAAIVAVFLLAIGGLWMMREPEPDEAAIARAARRDPLAARRQAMAPPAEPGAATPAPDAERPFLEPAGKGSVAYSSGDYASALARYEEAVRQNPQDAESLSNLGQVLVRMQRTAEAVPYFERAAALNPKRWAYRFNLARAQGLLQHWDEAIASYREAQTLFPDDYATTFNLALTMHKKGDDAGAVAEYKKAIALNPGRRLLQDGARDQLRSPAAEVGGRGSVCGVSTPVAAGGGRRQGAGEDCTTDERTCAAASTDGVFG